MILLEDKQLKRKFVLTNSVRLAILSGLLLLSLFVGLFFKTPFPTVPILLSLSIAVAFSLTSFFLIRIVSYRTAIYMQLGMDLMVVTLLVYFSGGITSPFYFLYILPIIVSALFLKRMETIYVATFAFIIFGLLADMMFLEILPVYPGLSQEKVPLATFIYNLLMSFIAFSAVAMISSFYFEKIRTADEKLRNVRENLEDLMQLNNTVLEKMQNGFVTCSRDGSVISYNEIARRMLRLDKHGNVIEMLLTPQEQGELRESKDRPGMYLEKEINRRILGITVTRLSGLYALAEVFVVIMTDLTEKKRIEYELKEREHLALIGEMAAGLAHEIRNPLASISGSVQFLSREMRVEAEYENLMQIIVRESSRLSRSIENFLNFTRTPEINMETVSLAGLVDDVVELLQTSNPGIRFELRCDRTLEVEADPRQMSQVIWNLLNNAVKAVGDSGQVEVAVFRDGREVRMSVKDNGIGMSPEEKRKMFSPFFSKFSSGIGLGMALVKRILDSHEFTVQVHSEKNEGTEVTICIPGKM